MAVAQTHPTFRKCLGPRRHFPKKGCLRHQAIKLAHLKGVKAWGCPLKLKVYPETRHTRSDPCRWYHLLETVVQNYSNYIMGTLCCFFLLLSSFLAAVIKFLFLSSFIHKHLYHLYIIYISTHLYISFVCDTWKKRQNDIYILIKTESKKIKFATSYLTDHPHHIFHLL